MAALNALNCLQTVGNSGNPKCTFDPAFISGAILAPTGSIIDPTANSGNILTTMTSLFYAANKAARFYPFYDFEKPTDSSDKLILQSMPNGAKHPVREGFNDWTYQYFDGGLTKHLNARTFNGTNWDFYFISTDLQTGFQQLIGISDSTGTKLQAIPVNPGGYFWAHVWGVNTGSERTKYELQFSYNQRYMNLKGVTSFLTLPFTIESSLPGLTDVNVLASVTVSIITKHFYVTLVNPTGVDIGSLYASVIGAGVSSAAYWTGAAVATPGLPYTITSATYVPSVVAGVVGYFDILVGATNYAAPPAPSYINIAAPMVLAAVGIDYESTGALSIISV